MQDNMSRIACSQTASVPENAASCVSPNSYTVTKVPQKSNLFELTVVSGPLVGSKTVVEAISPSLAYFNVQGR